MKITKTQRALLERAARNSYGRTSVVTGWYTTRKSGGRHYGTREYLAAKALVEAKLLVRVGDADHSATGIRGPKGGYVGTHYGTDWGYAITEAGRVALETQAVKP
jgi:hypothetical protein